MNLQIFAWYNNYPDKTEFIITITIKNLLVGFLKLKIKLTIKSDHCDSSVEGGMTKMSLFLNYLFVFSFFFFITLFHLQHTVQ